MNRCARQLLGVSVLAALAGGLSIGSGVAAAQPTVRVRAETRIELRTEQDGEHVQVRGVLRDDLGTPLPGRDIALRVRAPRGTADVRRARTGEDGSFVVPLTLPEGTHDLIASFPGDPTHDGVEVERRIDRTRADVRLEVLVADGGRLDLDQARHAVVVRARSAAGGAGLDVELRDELDRTLAMSGTDASGRARFTIDSETLGAPGAGRLKARSRADDRRAEAQTEVPIVRFRTTALTLEASPRRTEREGRVRFTGTLSDRAGPVSDKAIGLFAQDQHVATVKTDGDGRYEAAVAAPAVEGPWTLQARFESDSPGRSSTRSSPVTVRVDTPAAPSWVWLLVPLLLATLASFVLARRSPPSPTRAERVTPPPPAGFSTASRKSRRPGVIPIAGRVVDHRDEEPVGHATITLLRQDGEEESYRADAQGRFTIASPPAGQHRLRVSAGGYAAEEANIEIPHRGDLSDLRVRLESLRERALAPFRKLALAMLGSPRAWPTTTNREVVRFARQAPSPALRELSHRVEQAYYDEEPPTPEDVDTIEAIARRVEEGWTSPRDPG